MPLKLNVGLSRKVSQDYNSKGFSLNIEAELPANLIDNPDGLADATNHLFQLANDLVDEQVRMAAGQVNDQGDQGRSGGETTRGRRSNGNPQGNGSYRSSANGDSHGNGRPQNGNGNGNGHSERPITQAQTRAITNIGRRLDIDVDQRAWDEFGVRGVKNLSLKQGSAFIDLLKKEVEAGQTAGSPGAPR